MSRRDLYMTLYAVILTIKGKVSSLVKALLWYVRSKVCWNQIKRDSAHLWLPDDIIVARADVGFQK